MGTIGILLTYALMLAVLVGSLWLMINGILLIVDRKSKKKPEHPEPTASNSLWVEIIAVCIIVFIAILIFRGGSANHERLPQTTIESHYNS